MLWFVVALSVVAPIAALWCVGDLFVDATMLWRRNRRDLLLTVSAIVIAMAIAAALRCLLVPAHHAMYLDEPWYAEAACNLVRLGRLVVCEQSWLGQTCADFGKGPGWPVSIAPWTLIFGCDTTIGIQLSRVYGCASVLLAALAARLCGGDWRNGAITAVLVAIHPVHVAWSATAETNVPAAATMLLGLCGALWFARSATVAKAVLAAAALGLAVAMRPEVLLPGALTAVAVAWRAKATRSHRLATAALIGTACAAAAASGLGLWSMNESISAGAFLKLENIVPNLLRIEPTELLAIDLVVFALALAGSAALLRRSRMVVWLLLTTATTTALIALAYDRFHPRMLLTATVAVAPLCGFALDWLPRNQRWRWGSAATAVLLLLLGILWYPALLSSSFAPETQLLETRIAASAGRLPANDGALWIAAQPPVLAAGGLQSVMSTSQAVREPRKLNDAVGGRPVYFLCDMYCEPGFEGSDTSSECNQIFATFAATPVVEQTLNARTYAIYRLTKAAEPGSSRRRCPISSR